MKNKLRRLQTFLLCVILLALMIPPATAGALGPGERFPAEEMEYQINEDGATVTLATFLGDESRLESLVIPASVTAPDGKPYAVTKIGSWVFSGMQNLRSVHIPQGITEIGEACFADCYELRTVTFDEGMTSLTTIGPGAFYGLNLTAPLRIPYGVHSIGVDVLSIQSPEILLPDTLTYVGSLPPSDVPVWLEVGKDTELIAPGTKFRVSDPNGPDAALDIDGVELRPGGKVTNNGDAPLPVRLPDGTKTVLAPGEAYPFSFTESHDVNLTYVPGIDGGMIYSMDIAWGSLDFTYNEGGPGVWNPDTHQYDGAAEQGWSADDENGDLITVTNHSNAAIEAVFTYNGKTGQEAVTGALTGAGITAGAARLPTAEGTTPANAPRVTAKLALSGSVANPAPQTQTAVGAVTVTINPVN